MAQTRLGVGGDKPIKKKGKDKKFDEDAFLKEFQQTSEDFSTQPAVGSDTRVKRQFLIFSATLVHVDYTRLFKSGAKGTMGRGGGIAMTDEESKSSSFERCIVCDYLACSALVMLVLYRLIAALKLPAPPLVFDFTRKSLMVERLMQCVPPALGTNYNSLAVSYSRVMDHHRYKAECAQGQKEVTLYKFLLTQPGRVIVFVNHVSSVRALCAMLQVRQSCLGTSCVLIALISPLIHSMSLSVARRARSSLACWAAAAAAPEALG